MKIVILIPIMTSLVGFWSCEPKEVRQEKGVSYIGEGIILSPRQSGEGIVIKNEYKGSGMRIQSQGYTVTIDTTGRGSLSAVFY